jgi:hypothetical protein
MTPFRRASGDASVVAACSPEREVSKVRAIFACSRKVPEPLVTVLRRGRPVWHS